MRIHSLRYLASGLLVLALAASCAPGDEFARKYAVSESGFEGAVEIVSAEMDGGYAMITARVPYLGIEGNTKSGLARLVARKKYLESGKPLPAFCHVHYEMDVKGAKKWAHRGWAAFTAAYTEKEGESPIDCSVGNGYNLARAVIQWARRLPFIDGTRLHIDGGSQGGYMALAMSADAFPVTSATADVPVVNWAYNLSYFEANKGPMRYPATLDESPLPVLCSVTMLADWSYNYFTNDLSDDAWYYVSPISCVDRIANPVLVMSATGDMLVPMEQMTRAHLRPVDMTRFPDGFQRAFDPLTRCDKARVVFEDLLPKEQTHIIVQPPQENTFELTLEMFKDGGKKPKPGPKDEDKPWSKEHQWNLLYLDEGGPSPVAGHTTFEWVMSPDSYTDYYRDKAPGPEILNAAKLEWVMRRYARQLNGVPNLKSGVPANRLNFADVETRDVVAGLLDYASMSEAHTARLADLYRDCPVKSFGEALSVDALRALQQQPTP